MRISILDISRAGCYEERSQAGCLCYYEYNRWDSLFGRFWL